MKIRLTFGYGTLEKHKDVELSRVPCPGERVCIKDAVYTVGHVLHMANAKLKEPIAYVECRP